MIIGNESVAVGAVGEFAWTPSGGIQAFDNYMLHTHGLDLGDWTLHYLTDMPPDGQFIIGNGSHPLYGPNVAFRITIPEPGSITMGLCATALACRWFKRRRG